jgi:hypothetical protein
MLYLDAVICPIHKLPVDPLICSPIPPPLQMLISLAFCAVISLVLAGLAGIVHWFKEPGTTDSLKMSEDEIKNYNTGLIGGLVSGCYTSRLKAQKVLRR